MAKNPETMNELIERMVSILPDAVVEEQHGQIVIWTGLREVSGGRVEEVPPE